MVREITVPALLESFDEIFEPVCEMVQGAVRDTEIQNNIFIAVEEIFTNIVKYAYPSGAGDVSVSFLLRGDMFSATFVDSGIPFNPLEAEPPDLTIPAEERQIGGLGIYMVRKMMDNVKYLREGGKNILTLEKYFSHGKSGF